jgi:hypothetical protein
MIAILERRKAATIAASPFRPTGQYQITIDD